MITRIRVQNFKSLRDVILTLGLRNVLVGPNMAGKSNVIDVFRFLNRLIAPPPGGAGVIYALNSMNGFGEVAWKGADSSVIAFSLEGEESGGADTDAATLWKYELSLQGHPQGGAHVKEERLTVEGTRGRVALIDHENGARVVRRADGVVFSRFEDRERVALDINVPDWEGNVVREQFASWRFYKLVPQAMKQVNPTAAVQFLTEHGENLSSWLMLLQTRYPESFAQITAVMRDVFPSIEDVFNWPTQQSTVFVSIRERYLKRPVPVWQMSDGELAFLALVSLIYAPEDYGSALYCVEEPESHLHPKLIQTLIELHDQERDKRGSEQLGQVIISTHSPHLIDRAGLDELVVVERAEGATRLSRPSDKSHLRELLAREEIGLGDLYYSGALSGS